MENTIISFINQQVRYARQNPIQAELYEHNAYGATRWKIQRTNDHDRIHVWEDRYYPVIERMQKADLT